MILKLFALLTICLTAFPVGATQDNTGSDEWAAPPEAPIEGLGEDEGGTVFETPPPAQVEGWDKGDATAESAETRVTVDTPSCGDSMVNGEEVCDPSAYRGLLSNLCNASCELTIPQEQHQCVMLSFNDCRSKARQKMSDELTKAKEEGLANEEFVEQLSEQFFAQQQACYESAFNSCLPKSVDSAEVEQVPEINVPAAPLNALSGSGCRMSTGTIPSIHQGLVWGFALLMGGFGFLRTRF